MSLCEWTCFSAHWTTCRGQRLEADQLLRIPDKCLSGSWVRHSHSFAQFEFIWRCWLFPWSASVAPALPSVSFPLTHLLNLDVLTRLWRITLGEQCLFSLHPPQSPTNTCFFFSFTSWAFVHTLRVAINHIFNLMYEYVIYVARAEDINLFCGGRGRRGDNSADVPLLIGWLNSVCSL